MAQDSDTVHDSCATMNLFPPSQSIHETFHVFGQSVDEESHGINLVSAYKQTYRRVSCCELSQEHLFLCNWLIAEYSRATCASFTLFHWLVQSFLKLLYMYGLNSTTLARFPFENVPL